MTPAQIIQDPNFLNKTDYEGKRTVLSTIDPRFKGMSQQDQNTVLDQLQPLPAGGFQGPGSIPPRNLPNTSNAPPSPPLDWVPQILPAAVGALGAAAGSGIGSIPLSAGGAAAGSELASGLQQKFPKLFGNAPEDPEMEAGKEALMQGVLPEVGGKVIGAALKTAPVANLIAKTPLRNFPAVREAVAEQMTKKGLGKYQFPETGILESAAQNAGDTKQSLVDAYKTAKNIHVASDDYANGIASSSDMNAIADAHEKLFGNNQVGKSLVKLNKEFQAGPGQAATQSYKKISSTALSDVSHVRNWKLATGEDQTINQLALNDLVTNGYSESSGKIDAAGIINKLAGPKKEIYEEAIDPGTLGRFKDFLGALQDQEKGGMTNNIINYADRHLKWIATGSGIGAAGAIAAGHPLGAATLAIPTGMVLTNKMLGKLMSNPETANLVTQAIRTPSSAPEAGFINQALSNAMRGIVTGTQEQQ